MPHAIEKESGLNKPRMPKLESWLKNINQLSPRGRWSQMRCANWIAKEVCCPPPTYPAIDKMLMGRLTAHSEYSHTCPSDLARVQAGTEDQLVSPFSCFLWAARAGTAAAGMLRSQGIHLPTFQREPGNTNDGSARQRAQADPKGNDLQTKGKIGRLGSAEAGAGGRLPCHLVFTIGGQGTGGLLFVYFVFVRFYLFIYFHHSNFEQILSSEMGMALGQTRSTRRNLTLTGVHSPSLFSGIFDEPGIMHHTPNFVRISLRLRE